MIELGSAVVSQPPTGADAAGPVTAGESPVPGAGGWTALAAELDRWAVDGRVATFWWRDDDATDATPALDRLLSIAAAHRVSVALAVIPADATPALADRLAAADGVTVLQHGWAHRNHAPPGARKAELGDDRPVPAVLADLDRGRKRLAGLFGPGAGFDPALLVPPWNRAGPAVSEALRARGIALSRFGGRPAGDRLRLDTHVDPVAWKAPATGRQRPFLGEDAALDQAIRHLAARRTGTADPVEATGLLTHHLVHDEETWAFLARFVAMVAAHPAAAWCRAGDALAAPLATPLAAENGSG